MAWDPTIKFTDLAIIGATLLGPVFAVQAQRIVDLLRDRKRRRTWIFQTLMTTRATILARLGRVAEARSAVRRALEIDPAYLEAADLLRSLAQ